MDRSIPACAGEPHPTHTRYRRRKVYPRVCGGTCQSRLCQSSCSGLSPRVRGNQFNVLVNRCFPGSIPACAGEPREVRELGYMPGVYPRVCGGTMGRGATGSVCSGLSPRVRGNLGSSAGIASSTRSIPACAGEPICPTLSANRNAVYPRVCGGTRDYAVSIVGFDGLSPRVRGNQGRYGLPVGDFGSIPACAGEPQKERAYGQAYKVYPRVCGGTTTQYTGISVQDGLSPRVRGNQVGVRGHQFAVGSIPACAGEP